MKPTGKKKRRSVAGRTRSADDLQGALKASASRDSVVLEAVATAVGGVAGAILGAPAGPPGVVAGAILGAATGTTVEGQIESAVARRHHHDAELDEAIGVIGGDIGVPPKPPRKR